MNTVEQAIESVRAFEEARAKEDYTKELPTVLKRVPLMEFEGTEFGMGFDVKAGVEDKRDGKGWVGNGQWEASLTDRNCSYEAETPEAAIGAMIKGACQLGYDGSVNPARPKEPGAPPVQHCMNLLQQRLGWHLERRQDALRDRAKQEHDHGDFRGASYSSEEAATKAEQARKDAAASFGPLLGHHNEAIAALGTAVSALARVKDL